MGCFPSRSSHDKNQDNELPEETSISFLKKSSNFQKIDTIEAFLIHFPKLFIKPFLNTSCKYELSQETQSFGHFGLHSRVNKALIKASKIPVLIEQISLNEIDSKSQTLIKSFFSNLDFIRAIDHPNILKIIDIYEEKEGLYIVYEDFIGGVDLYDKICEMGGFSEKHAGLLLKDLLSILTYLHNQGHSLNKISAEAFHVRFYKGAYQLKLIDLTLITPIAILLENIKDNVKNQGFIRDFYSPPEDPDIKSVGKYKRESFSLGVLFFLMLKGNFPFNQEEIDVSEKEELGEFYNISYEDLEVNEETCRLLKGLLEIDIEKRISIEEARKSVFFKEVSRNIRKNIEDIRKNANLECFMKPIYGFFKVLLVRFFADQIEKDNLLEIFQEIDEDSDGFIDGGLFGLETIRKNLGFEDFLILSLRKWNLEENKAKDFVFMEISKGNAKVLILENLWEFMGKELIEKEVLERLFKEISRPNIQVFLKDFEKIDF